MNEESAVDFARNSLAEHSLPKNAKLISATESYIEIAKFDESDNCTGIRDQLVWLVSFEKPQGWIQFAVDQDELEIIRVEKSR